MAKEILRSSLLWLGRRRSSLSRFEEVSLVLAGLSTPLVFSVHSIVSFDFATSVVPDGTLRFFLYSVAGAVFSGFAMVLTLMLVVRKIYKLEHYLTIKHIEYMNIVIIVTGSIVGVAYLPNYLWLGIQVWNGSNMRSLTVQQVQWLGRIGS